MNSLNKDEKKQLLEADGTPLAKLCVGCSWGQIVTNGFLGLGRRKKNVDLDLSCAVFNRNGEIIDHIYSPLYRQEALAKFGLPAGKLTTADHSLVHSGDDSRGDADSAYSDTDNEVITVDLRSINPEAAEIFFFLNSSDKTDFSKIPYTYIRLYKGDKTDEKQTITCFDISSSHYHHGHTALIMGKITRNSEGWEFTAIGDGFNDPFLGFTIHRIAKEYANKK